MHGAWAIVRLGATDEVPDWALHASGFVSVTRTNDELSIVCPESAVPNDVHSDLGWAVLKLQGPFPFAQVGVLASCVSPLAEANISVFALSTFDTDYILVKATQISAACQSLTVAGHELTG